MMIDVNENSIFCRAYENKSYAEEMLYKFHYLQVSSTKVEFIQTAPFRAQLFSPSVSRSFPLSRERETQWKLLQKHRI